MRRVTKENLIAQIERLYKIKDEQGQLSMNGEYTLQAYKMLLAAMDSEPHTDDELSNLLWYSQEATCHSDPNYYYEFQRLATPGFIAGIISELQERRKAAMDSEPVVYASEETLAYAAQGELLVKVLSQPAGDAIIPLYRHAQLATQPAPVVPKPIRVGPKPIHCGKTIDGGHNWPITCREGEYQCGSCKLREELRELRMSKREGA